MFDEFYRILNSLLDTLYPLRTVTMSNRDPPFVKPVIKGLLRRRNKLMRCNRTEAANAITLRINRLIIQANCNTFSKTMSIKQLWEKVRSVSGSCKKSNDSVPNISSELLNEHYANISTDKHYRTPIKKPILNEPVMIVDEYEVFQALDKMRPTSPGLDDIPHWFLRIAAPFICQPLAFLCCYAISPCHCASYRGSGNPAS